MPWQNRTTMSQRYEFVLLASTSGTNFRELCRRFGIAPKTGYKWLHRFKEAGEAGLADRSRRPRSSPARCPDEIEALVIALRQEQPTWGGRKLRRRLQDLGHTTVPSASTCTEIMRRAHLLHHDTSKPPGPFQRFVRAYPNELWQMDFKGDFATQSGSRCYPLTVLDDHSRFNVVLAACANQTGATVQSVLSTAFTLYGLPEWMLCDNGPPWGCSEPVCPYTSLTVWLLRLGVRVLHGRPYHPQTQGKEERFHRTFERDLLVRHTWIDVPHCGQHFARYREQYNCIRPHDSLQGATPISRYQPSPRPMPAQLPLPQYALTDQVAKVREEGTIGFQQRRWYVGRAFAGLSLGLRPSAQADGQWQVLFGDLVLGIIDLRLPADPNQYARSIYLSPSIQ